MDSFENAICFILIIFLINQILRNQVPELSSKVLSTLSIFLGLPHVHVRKTTATKLYEALILHADACGVPEENLDEVIEGLD